MPQRRRPRTLRGKGNEKHSGTKVHIIGPATVATPFHIIRDSEVGDRDPAGGNDTITLGRSFEEECNIGDCCKYLNVHIQAGPRTVNNLESAGWIEWAIVMAKGTDAPPTNANIGISTLGDICTKYYRNECILTGNLPVSANACSSQEIAVKVPKTKMFLRTGDEWNLFVRARTTSSTETSTASFKVLTFFNYKNYH